MHRTKLIDRLLPNYSRGEEIFNMTTHIVGGALGGIAYTIGAVLYALAAKKEIKYMHSVFHIFVVIGSFLQFVSILFFILR